MPSCTTDGRATLAHTLIDERARFAELALQRRGSSIPASPLLARSLVSALGRAVQTSSPDPVMSWARIARQAHGPTLVHELLGAACEVVAEAGEAHALDFSALLVFLEIVKTTVADAFPLAARTPAGTAMRGASAVIEGVLAMLKARDEATCAHSQATGEWCRRIAEAMHLPAPLADTIVKAGVLHDIGKIATPDAILFKPGPLTPDEWSEMQKHAEFGAAILAELPALAPYAPIVRAHHERWDGLGYPHGLTATEIPFEARVVAVADAFHAMISHRPYRAPIPQREALAILRDGRGTQWDGTVVDAMLSMLRAQRSMGRRTAAHA
ncbi:MAG TPA: HD-GYP domain-containing protein [Candidatus Elarobacter sp.]|jgi:HD-GYP domain-containing protein (c-di-GMP phosphodiesterase class II)|nr:HD-GYP domain-containing protein [Candidatus Elarobacter sp.]